MDFFGKDKLSRLDEERQRRRQQRADEALRRLEEVGKQTQQLVANHTTTTQTSAQNVATDASGRRPGALSRVLFEQATGNGRGERRKNKLDPRNLLNESQKALAQIDGAMSTIKSSVVDATGAGLRGGLEEASKSVTDIVDRVASLANGTVGTLSPSANKNPLAELMAEEQAEENKQRFEAGDDEKEDHRSKLNLENKLDSIKAIAEKATGLDLGEKRGGDDDEGSFQFQSQLQGVLPHEAMHAAMQGGNVNLREIAANAASHVIAQGDKGNGLLSAVGEAAHGVIAGEDAKTIAANVAGNFGGEKLAGLIGGKVGDAIGGAAGSALSSALLGEKPKLGDMIGGAVEAMVPDPFGGVVGMAMGAAEAIQDGKGGRIGEVVSNAASIFDPSNVANVAMNAATMSPQNILNNITQGLDPAGIVANVTEKVASFDANAMLSNIGSALEPANFAKMAGVAGGALTNLPGSLVGIAGQAFENVTARLKDAADLLNPSTLPKGESPNDAASGLPTGKRQHEPLTPTPEHAAGDPAKQMAQVTSDPNATGGQAPNAAMMQTQGMPPAGPTKPPPQPGEQKADPTKPEAKPAEAAKDAKGDAKGDQKAPDGKDPKAAAAESAKQAKNVDDKGAGQKKPADDPKAHKQAETAGKATDGPAKSADAHAAKGAVAATAHAGTATPAGQAAAKGEGAAAATANQQLGHAAPPKQPAPNPQGAPQSNRPAAERHQAAQPTKTANTTNRNAAPTTSASGGAQQINPQPVNSPPAREVAQNEKTITQPNVTIEAKGESGALPGMPADLATQTPPAGAQAAAAGTPAKQAQPAPPSTQAPTPKTVAPLPTVTPAPATAAKQNPPTTVTMPQAKGQPMGAGGAPAATGATPQPKSSSGASQAGAQSVPANAKAAPPPPAAKIPEQKAAPGTAAPQTPATQAPEPNIPPVRAPGGDGAPNPSGMVPQTANLSADRSNAQQQLTAEAQTQSKVGPEANTLKQSQVASQKPAFEQTKRSGDAPRQQAVTASTAQGQQAGQAGHQRGQQAAASGNQQIQGQGQQAAGERAQLQGTASANSAAVVQQTSPAVMQGAAAPAQAAVQAAATAGRAQQVIVNPAAVARAGQAGATNSQLPPFDAQRFGSIDQQLAQPMPETNMAQADQGKQAADQTYQQANQQIEQLANIQAPAINAPQSAGAGTKTKDGQPTREAAIANVEQQVTAQAQAQGPAKMQEAARPLQQEVKQHATSAQQAATTSADSQLQQHKAKEQQIKQQPPPTTGAQAAAQAQPQYQAHQAEATAASTQMKSEIAGAQTAANTATQQAKSARDQQITQAQSQYQQQSTAAQGQYASAQQAAKGQFDSQNQAAQSAMANEQQQAQQAAAQQTQAAQQKADADISQQQAQLNSQQQQANASHQQQMEAANQQHDAQVQAAQAQMDADVSSQQSQMQSQVSAEQSRGQQEVNQHLSEGEQGYQREIQAGEQQAQAEKARAEAEAAEKERQAQAEKDKNSGGIFGKVVGWVKDRFNDMMNAVKAVLAAARDLIVSIMEKARQAAIAVLNRARQAALAALAKVKSAIQGIISACASAIRNIISACASLVRNLIQNLANMLKSLVQALTTLLQTLVQAFQAAVNALLDGLIAAVSLINKDLGDKLRSATQKYRDAFNNAMNNLQQGIKAAGDALQAKIQQAADGAIAVVNAAEQTLNAAVTRVEQTLNAAVELAYQVGAAAINKAFDAAELVVNKAFEVAEAAVKAYFDAQIAALDLVQQGVNAVADFVIAVADKVLEAVAKIAEAIVNMIPESWTKWFVDFWNGPWRQAIIIGLATVAAVAITVATCGAAGPVAMILVAGLIGGTIAGTAYAGGELLAREGAIHLTEEHPGEGVYVPGVGNVQIQIGPDGKPIPPANLTPEQQAAWEKNSQWALSNFNTQRDAEGNVTGYDRKSGSEIANYAVQEGMKGFGEGFISAAGAMGGSLAGGAVAGLGIVGRVASNPIARQMIATAVEGGVGVVSQSVGAGWTAGFDAMAEGKSPGDAFSAAWKAGSEQITDPGNWVAAMASVGVVPLKTKAIGPLMDRATGRIANQAVSTAIKEGTDVVVDTMAETVGNAGGAFVSTYYKAIQEGKSPAEAMTAAQSAASDSFKPEAIAQSLLMNTAGNISNKGAERYAARRAAETGGTPDAPHTTPDQPAAEPAQARQPSNDPAPASDGRPLADRPTQPSGEPTPDGNPRTTRGGDESNPSPRVAPSESTEAQRNKPAVGEDTAPPVQHSDQAKQDAQQRREAAPIRERKDAPPKRTDTDQPVDTNQDTTLRGQDGQPVHADDTAQQQQTAAQKPKETNEPQRFQDRQTDQARIDQQMAEKGHSGIEVHSHFMGNVDPSSFASTIARSGDAPMLPRNPDADTASGRMGDHSPYEPVMREIAKLNDFRHTTATNEAGDTIITTRGRSGDALMQIDAAQQRIENLKLKLEREGDTMSPDARKRLETEIHDEARSAVEKALRASDETDFNSSYEVRDELVKKFYGVAERNDILGAKGVDPKNARMTDPKVVEAYTEHFQGRKEILERIPQAVEAQRRLDAGDFKDGKEQKALQKQADAIKEQMAYDAYAKDTILELARDGITYTEQSNSLNKIGARFDEGQIDWIKNQLIAEHANDPKMVQALQNLTIRHVTMINTNQFGVRGDGHRGPNAQVKTDDLHQAAGTVRPPDAEFTENVKQLVAQTRRGDVIGVDIAGAEHFTFDGEGQRRMTELYDALLVEAGTPGGSKPLVLRPHVGEGANDVVPGAIGHRDANRQIVDGPDGPELSHYQRAKENIDSLLKVFEAIAARPENGGKLPPDVIVRFGHATHTTPEMAARMAKLGIIAEVNLTSNIETGSVSQKPPANLDGKQDNTHAPSPDDPRPRYEQDPSKRTGTLDDHALATLIAADAPVILSTDAHSVMSTNMANEYNRARSVIDEVRSGQRKVPVDESIIDPSKPPGTSRLLSYDEMPPHLRERFDRAERKLYEDANRYFDMRPKQDGEGSATPTTPKPSDGPVRERKIGADDFEMANLAKSTNDPATLAKRAEFNQKMAEASNQAMDQLRAGRSAEEVYQDLIKWRASLESDPVKRAKLETAIAEGDPNFDPFGTMAGKREGGVDTQESLQRARTGEDIKRRFEGVNGDTIQTKITLPDGTVVDGNKLHRGASADEINQRKGNKYGYEDGAEKFITETASPADQKKLHDAGIAEIDRLIGQKKQLANATPEQRAIAMQEFADAAYMLFHGPIINRGSDSTIRVMLTAAYTETFGHPPRLPQDIDIRAYSKDQATFRQELAQILGDQHAAATANPTRPKTDDGPPPPDGDTRRAADEAERPPGKPIAPELKQKIDALKEGESVDLGKRGGKDGLVELLRHQEVEFGVFRDSDGNYYVIRGGEDYLAPRSPSDRLVAHNHPGGTKRLSPDDLDYMRTSTGGKQKSTLLLTPGKDGGVTRERVRDYTEQSQPDGDGVGFASGEDALGHGEGAVGTPPLPSTDTAPASTGATVTVETEWDAADGSGRTRDNVGVGERVFLTADVEGAWTATTGTRRGTGQQFIWTAPGTAGAATITFTPTGGGAAVTKTLTVVAPTSIRMTKTSDDTFDSGTVGAGFVADVTFHPLNVSFAATQWKEDTGQRGTAATGAFVAARGRRAVPMPTHAANPNWLGIGANNSGPTDHAAFSFTGANFSQGGSFKWSIAQRWKLRSASAAGGLIETLDQTCTIEGDPHAGRTTVAKGGASSTRSPDGTTPAPPGGESEGRGSGSADGPPTSWGAVGEGLSTDGAKDGIESLGHTEAGGRGVGEGEGLDADGIGKADAPAPPKSGPPTPKYINDNRVKVLVAIADHIKDESFELPLPHPRLTYVSREQAKFAIAKAIWEFADGAPKETLKQLSHLAYPANLFELASDARRGPSGSQLAVVQARLAAAFDAPLRQSILRMGTRTVARLDEVGGIRRDVGIVIASSPLDALVARVLIQPGITAYGFKKKGAADDTGGKPFSKGADGILEYEWLGKRDRNLWNWIKVTKPASVTAEQVAMMPLVGDGNENATQAYRIAANPPYFGIPFETARRVKEAWDYAPAELERKLTGVDAHGPRVADPSVLGKSVVSDDAALADAPKAQKSDLSIERAIDRTQTQLKFMASQLAPWKLARPLDGAIQFVDRRKAEVVSGSKTVQRFASAMTAQERILNAAASELADLMSNVAKKEIGPESAHAIKPIVDVFRAYAEAAGVSHVHDQAQAALAEARHRSKLLPLALAEDKVRSARAALSDERQTEGSEERSENNVSALVKLEKSQASLRAQATKGKDLDPDAVEELTIDASELELRARLVTLTKQVKTLKGRAGEVGLDKGRHPSGSWSVDMVCELILDKVDGTRDTAWQKRLDAVNAKAHGQDKDPRNGALLSPLQTRNKNRLNEIKFVEASLQQFSQTNHLYKKNKDDKDDFFTWAYDAVKDKELANLILSIAIQVGVALLTGQVAGAVGATFRGLTAASEIATALRGTSLLYRGASIAAQAAMQTGTQAAMGGKVTGSTFVENALGLVLTSAAMKPFQALLDAPAAVEQQIISQWRAFAKASGRFVAEMVIDAGAGITAAALARQVVQGGKLDMAHSEEWITQGLSFAANRFAHGRAVAMQQRLHEAGKNYADKTKLKKLQNDVENFRRETANKENITPEKALEQLTKRRQLLLDEMNLLPADSTARKTLANQHANESAEYAEVPLQLAGLSPVVQGHIYEGTPDVIAKAKQAAKDAGVELKPLGDNRYKIGENRIITIQPTGGTARAVAGASKTAHSIGPDVRVVSDGVFEAKPSKLEIIRDHWQLKGSKVSELRYDPATNSMHFELHQPGMAVVRVQSSLGPRINTVAALGALNNKVMSPPMAVSTGHEIIQRLNRGDASDLAALGISGSGKVPRDTEFGLGLLPDKKNVVIVKGKGAEVDWGMLPGLHPLAHTHKITDLPHKQASVPLKELIAKSDGPHLAREIVFPSGADFIVMAQQGIEGHVVYTEWVVRGGKVMRAPDGDTGPRLSFTIVKSAEVGLNGKGQRLYKATVEIKPGGTEKAITKDVWVLQHEHGDNGHLFMSQPKGTRLFEPTNPQKGSKRTQANDKTRITARTPGLSDSIDPNVSPPGIRIEHLKEADVRAKVQRGEAVELETDIHTTHQGKAIKATIRRYYDPKTQTLEMRSAGIPDGFPSWVSHPVSLDPARPSAGIPLFTLVQMQQLKVLGIGDGQLKHLKLSTVFNVVTTVQVHIEARNRGVAPDKLPPDALLKTHSAEYSDTPLVQSGHRMVSAKLTGGTHFTLSELLKDWADNGYTKAVAAARKLMQDNNVDDGARVLTGFDMDVQLAPSTN